MKTITLKTDDALFNRVSHLSKQLHLSKSELIRRAIVEYEKEVRRQALKERMREASMRVRASNRQIVEAFEETLTDGLDDV
ncbi:CopG family ribbon-helix-helix protein [Nitratifractor sp.]